MSFRKLWNKIKSLFYTPKPVPRRGGMLRDNYRELYESMELLPQYQDTIGWYERKALSNKEVYVKVGLQNGVPWEVVAALHAMEASFNLEKQFLNGQLWSQKTTWVPKGLGPWESFEDSCRDAFKYHDFPIEPTLEQVLDYCERYNGTGYYKRGKQSPYLWSMSNIGLGTGKFVSDGRYDPTAISKQLGVACILKVLEYKDV